MSSMSDVFGLETVPPSEYRYASYVLTENSVLVWPENFSGEDLLSASILELSAGVGLTLTLPPASEVSVGRDILIRNIGANDIDILDGEGNFIFTSGTGEAKYTYISDNSTVAGVWQVFTFGTGTSSADATLLAGAGLNASSGKLRVVTTYKSVNANYSLLTTDRAKLLDVIAGTITINLLLASTVGDGFLVYVRNSSAGTTLIDAAGGDLIDGTATFSLAPGESLALISNGTDWKTVGYGRDATFVFSEIVVDASLPATSLTSSDVAGRMIRVAGVATANIEVTLPAIDNIYFVNVESGVGVFDVVFTTGAGSTVTLNADQKTVLYSDGTNISTAVNTSFVNVIEFVDGSVSAPSISFVLDTTTGFYRAGPGEVGFTSAGTGTVTFDATGLVADTVTTADAQITGGSITGITDLALVDGGTGASTAADARTNLELGTAATADLNNTLTSVATDEALTAAQGKVLKDLIDGIDTDKLDDYIYTDTAVSKTLVNRERCRVTSATQTITLPPTPTVGDEVAIGVWEFLDTEIDGNGENIMSLAQNMIIDKEYAMVTLVYTGVTDGWRVI